MKLLEQDFVLIVQPKLAMAVGMNEAMFLQQLHYWVTKCGVEQDGEKWIYNTYSGWHAQFPFLSERTIMRMVKKLEDLGVLVTANYNRFGFDKTKWYRINYAKLAELLGEPLFLASKEQNDKGHQPHCQADDQPKCQKP